MEGELYRGHTETRDTVHGAGERGTSYPAECWCQVFLIELFWCSQSGAVLTLQPNLSVASKKKHLVMKHV